MEIKTISVTYNRKVSDGNWGSIEVGATAWADLKEPQEMTAEGTAKAMTMLGDIIRKDVRKRALALMQDDKAKRQPGTKQDTKEKLPPPAVTTMQPPPPAPPEEEYP